MNSRTVSIVVIANVAALLIALSFSVARAQDASADSAPAAPAAPAVPDQEQLRAQKVQAEQDARRQTQQQAQAQRQLAQEKREQEQQQRQQDRQQDRGQRDQELEQKRQQAEKRLQEAQQQLERSAQEVAQLSLSLNEKFGPDFMAHGFGEPRVVLGINIDMSDAGAATGKTGVRVVSVSPGGPAEAAGLKANDVLISFNGKPLQGEPGKPAQRELLGNLAHVKVGTSVAVEYRRDDKVVKTQIAPKALPQPIEIPAPPNLEGLIDGRAFKFDWRGGTAGLGSADLVELSPALGKYFGTDKGLLVVRAPHDERLKLQDGDVILDIDGRVPSGVAHASQILGSYHAGETLKLHILRQQKRVELPVEIPADAGPTAIIIPDDSADRA